MMPNELKPCPFCGGEAAKGMHYVECAICGARVNGKDRYIPLQFMSEIKADEDAMYKWNRRVPFMADVKIKGSNGIFKLLEFRGDEALVKDEFGFVSHIKTKDLVVLEGRSTDEQADGKRN
jgi:hypothetical protein